MECKLCGRVLKGSRRKRCNSCNTKIRRYRAKKAAVAYLGSKCNRCGWCGNIAGFDFHHRGDKDFNIGNVANKSWEIIKQELDKCELLCANCHRIEHSDNSSEAFLIEVNNYKGKLLV
jgi:hypothetical protein